MNCLKNYWNGESKYLDLWILSIFFQVAMLLFAILYGNPEKMVRGFDSDSKK